MEALETWEIVLRLAAAMICGAILGFERELHDKPAGLRTHMMVALGAASFTLITIKFYIMVPSGSGFVRADPLRVIEGVIGGIGFLGAGSIIQSRGSVQGITTAAAIWVVGAIGVACGTGAYLIAVVTVAFAVVILAAFGAVERHPLGRRLGIGINRMNTHKSSPDNRDSQEASARGV